MRMLMMFAGTSRYAMWSCRDGVGQVFSSLYQLDLHSLSEWSLYSEAFILPNFTAWRKKLLIIVYKLFFLYSFVIFRSNGGEWVFSLRLWVDLEFSICGRNMIIWLPYTLYVDLVAMIQVKLALFPCLSTVFLGELKRLTDAWGSGWKS